MLYTLCVVSAKNTLFLQGFGGVAQKSSAGGGAALGVSSGVCGLQSAAARVVFSQQITRSPFGERAFCLLPQYLHQYYQ